MKTLLLNLGLYQIGWFACVVGAAWGMGSAGASVALLLVLVHLALVEEPAREWPLLVAALGMGLVADTLHARFGILEFVGHEAGELAPLWILALWLQFGTVLHFCMRWLSGRYRLAALLGLVGGPLTFLGGERLGAVAFGEPAALSLAILGLSWAVLLPTLVAIADRLGGRGRYRPFATSAPARVES